MNIKEIVNQEQIKAILEEFTGDQLLIELKFYLSSFKEELREIGVDSATLAWQIYETNKKDLSWNVLKQYYFRGN